MMNASLMELKLHEDCAPESIWNRRTSMRVPCCGERLEWKPEGRRRARRGWLNDVSDGGVSFLTEQKRTPCAGQTVEVSTDRNGEPMLCEVVRVIPEGEDLALVACRRSVASAVSSMSMAA